MSSDADLAFELGGELEKALRLVGIAGGPGLDGAPENVDNEICGLGVLAQKRPCIAFQSAMEPPGARVLRLGAADRKSQDHRADRR